MTIDLKNDTSLREILDTELAQLLQNLGGGRTDGVAYDTAWVARLAQHHDHPLIASSLNWLRHHQYVDGTWGAPVMHYHDRYLSTLSTIITLRLVGRESRDSRRIKRGENALWRIVGRVVHDDHDTIGFPLLSIKLAEEAHRLGLDVPQPPVRYAAAFNRKVQKILTDPQRNWRENTLSFSLEVLRDELRPNDTVIEMNNSVAVSPAATAGYLLNHENPAALNYLLKSLDEEGTGAARAVDSIDNFETAWAINHLRYADLISPDDPDVKRVLSKLWDTYTRNNGLGYSSYTLFNNVDDTAAGWAALKWAGYPVTSEIFAIYEAHDHFHGILTETDPAVSAHVRLLAALRTLEDSDPHKAPWIEKILSALDMMDSNGSFWTDKWHASPYYVNSTSIWALHGLNDKLTTTRLKWILRTQNDDGGWGYCGESTPEETAYCMEALLWWHKHVRRVDDAVLDEAARYLQPHISDERYTPLWIGKSLYSPHYVVKAAVLGAMYRYLNREV